MYHTAVRPSIFLLLLICITSVLQANDDPAAAINLKLDCHHCDRDYLQEEIPWVNFVRDRQNADVQVISTYQRTGSGGREYTLTFTGLEEFAGLCDTLQFVTLPAVTQDETRSEMAQHIKLGMVRYLARTPRAGHVAINYTQAGAEETQPIDRWDRWVFSSKLGCFLNGEESTSDIAIWGNLSAQRITETNKIEVSCWGNYNHSRYEYNDGTTYISESNSSGFSSAWAKSLTGHWSAGVWGGANRSTYNNIALEFRVSPGLEYNIFPYSESARRQLRITWMVTGRRRAYNEETIYLKTREDLVEHSLSARLELVRNWGSVTMELSGAQYLHDLTKNRVSLFNNISLQLVRGLSLTLDGRVSLIHNQLSLPREGAALEDVLLQRQQLSTQYDYWLSLGFRYTFGSIYSSIVNTRFGEW